MVRPHCARSVSKALALVALLASSAYARPTVVRVPATGKSEPQVVQTPAGALRLRFTTTAAPGAGVYVEIEGPQQAARGATFQLAPVLAPKQFRTRHFSGELWKCQPQPETGKWIVRDNREVVVSRESHDATPTGSSVVVWWLPLTRFASGTTEQLAFGMNVKGTPPVGLSLELEQPHRLPAVPAEMLRQYQKIGAALFAPGQHGELKFLRVVADLCGQTELKELRFDRETIQTLAFPSHDWRLSTAHSWVFAEPIASRREGAIGPVDFDKVDQAHLTFLGDLYHRELIAVETGPGSAIATFALGDFSGCLGASCGDPVNLRTARVSLVNGVLSTKIVRGEEP